MPKIATEALAERLVDWRQCIAFVPERGLAIASTLLRDTDELEACATRITHPRRRQPWRRSESGGR
jgi:hypothetical protein